MGTSKRTTVASAVSESCTQQLVLPDIQRTFVWRTSQIYDLFDSLMRGYPIGTLLIWRTKPADYPNMRFRQLVVNYKGTQTESQQAIPAKGKPVSAVLDGQQRLTALNIGLCGTHSGGLSAPDHKLYIDLDQEDLDAGAERRVYRFDFRVNDYGGDAWFPVSDALGLGVTVGDLNHALETAEVPRTPARRRVLRQLARAVNNDESIEYRIEKGDLDRALNIFARTNTGGTKLTYVDMLISAITTKWTHLDANKEIAKLRNDMNSVPHGAFKFTTDRIVKASLVLLDVKEPKFHVQSFTKGDLAKRLEKSWPKFTRAMTVAARLLSSFGLSGTSLSAENVVIPIAYYVYMRDLSISYVTSAMDSSDRAKVKAFVARTILQRRYWTGAVDPILVTSRKVIRNKGTEGFPLAELEVALLTDKSIAVTAELVDELCDLPYADRRTLTLLRLLFPFMVNKFPASPQIAKDHIYPRSRFTQAQMTKSGLPAGSLSELRDRGDRLPNLQLLASKDNSGKSNKWPDEWLAALPSSAQTSYKRQGVKNLSHDLAGFDFFYETRRKFMRKRIQHLLNPKQ